MRALLVAALVFIAALAGCSGKKGEEHDHLTYTCPNGTVVSEEDYEGVLENITVDFLKTKCPKAGSGSKTNTTAQAPNVLPVLMLTVTNDAGNVTNVTLVDGNLTFDATGSMDPDGFLSAIAISVQDSNTTRTLPLYDLASMAFKTATFKFDRAGVVNVSVAMVDDRAGFNTSISQVYVNSVQTIGGDALNPGPPAGANHECKGAGAAAGQAGQPNSGPVLDATYFKPYSFTVLKGAQFIEATPVTNKVVITICDPALVAISLARQDKTTFTTEGVVLVAPVGAESYFIGTYVKDPQTKATVTVTVHYEPRPVAAAA